MSSNNLNQQDLSQLFQGMISTDPTADGLSQAAVGLLIQNLDQQVVQGAQLNLHALDGTAQTIVAIVNDTSSSMGPYRTSFIEGYNRMLAKWRNSKGGDEFIISQWQFASASRLVHGYLPIATVPDLNTNTYVPAGLTALFDTVMDALKSTIAYVQQLQQAGNTVNVVFVIMTDGADNVSRQNKAQDIKVVVEDLIRQEIYHIALWGFGVDGIAIGQEMGIPLGNIMTTGTDDHGIVLATGQISKSTIRVSQGLVGVSSNTNFFTA